MKDIAIRAEGISKKYKLGEKRRGYKTIGDSITYVASYPFRALRTTRQSQSETAKIAHTENFWALKDISFEIRSGEVVGIIGRNGAGKSTVLKILSRITEPTCGYADIQGRVGSLLEVGSGFHPELTGRENIFMNGAILGMRRAEIVRKLDDIVAFAEVEQFVDTPVKHYSSGMYLRLAFAVAAFLESEILLVDEVLAVGDASFQKRCLGRMGELAGQGRTVLFVSHNMAAVQALCSRGLFLRNSGVWFDGPIHSAVNSYLETLEDRKSTNLLERTERRGAGKALLERVELLLDDGPSVSTVAAGRSVSFVFHITEFRPQMSCIYTIYDDLGAPVVSFNSAAHAPEDMDDPCLGAKFVCRIKELTLLPGRYRINAAIKSDGQLQDHIEGVAFFDVAPGTVQGRPVLPGRGYGRVCLPHVWARPVRQS